jgi:type IV secretion system protein VirD4
MLMNFANKAAKERSGVKSSLSQALGLWKTPEIDAVTSTSDFSLKDLKKKRIAIYIGVATGDIPTVAPLLNLFFEQLMTTLTMKLPEASEPRKVLILLDEFHMLGRMETVANVFTLAGGYNCRVLAVVQGLGWIDDVYGKQKRDGILSVCAHRIFFAANDLETARYVSEMCGEKTVQSVSTTRNSSSRFGSSTKNTSMRTWPLITKDQVTRLSRKSEIILAEASFPIKCQKVAYNLGSDAKTFGNRVMPAPSMPTLHIERYDIPKFDIPESDNQEGPDSNQGNFFKNKNDQIPEDPSNGENSTKPEKGDLQAGLFFDKEDDE